jgi:hypothetical protein
MPLVPFRVQCGHEFAIFEGGTLDEAYNKFVEHAQREHPELVSEDFVWESTFVCYHARKKE